MKHGSEPSLSEWVANGLAALDELRRLYFEGSAGQGPGEIVMRDWQACEDAIRASLDAIAADSNSSSEPGSAA